MDSATWVSIGSIATSSAVAVTAVWLAARYAHRQAHVGRVWERKADAYSEILEALHEMDAWFRIALDDEYARREVADDIEKERSADYDAARKKLRRRIGREIWLLAPETRKRIDAMQEEIAKRQESWFEYLDVGSYEIRKTIADIADLARTELREPAI